MHARMHTYMNVCTYIHIRHHALHVGCDGALTLLTFAIRLLLIAYISAPSHDPHRHETSEDIGFPPPRGRL